jgi:hypothetical protein
MVSLHLQAIMYNASTQLYWTQCDGKPCKGVWGSPAGNTPKYFFNFSNPQLADWWVYECGARSVLWILPSHTHLGTAFCSAATDWARGVRARRCSLALHHGCCVIKPLPGHIMLLQHTSRVHPRSHPVLPLLLANLNTADSGASTFSSRSPVAAC